MLRIVKAYESVSAHWISSSETRARSFQRESTNQT